MAGAREAYFSHVDGLRAIAILAVVGYHVGLPGLGGGFVGVDVFFVISGYLIIGQIAAQLRGGRFSPGEFFARRALRLLPMLYAVIGVTGAAAAVVLATPAELASFGQSAVAAAGMVSNHFFWATQDYFDTAAETKPLLHTWSLGVEAQFYVVAPLLIAACWRLAARPRLLWTIALALAAASAVGCWYWTRAEHNAAFFLMPLRAWEFTAGAAVLALQHRTGRWSPRIANLVALAGLLLIAGSVTFYSAAEGYPSWRPLLPVAGAALLLLAAAAPSGRLALRLLSLKPLVGIGLVSYGWYLWHWPLLSLWRVASFGRSGLASDFAIGAVGGLLLAVATYFCIERPIARAKHVLAHRMRFGGALATLAVAALAAAPGLYLWQQKAPAVEAGFTRAEWPTKTLLDAKADVCVFAEHVKLAPSCDVASGAKRGLLVGDSHARESYPALAAAAAQAQVRLVTMPLPGCPPLFGRDVLFAGSPQGCPQVWKQNLDTLASRHARFDFAIVQASWSIYLGAENGHRPPRLLAPTGSRKPDADQYATLQQELRSTLDVLRGMGVRRVLVIAPSPQYMLAIPECVLRAKAIGIGADTCDRPQSEIQAQRERTLAALRSALAGDGTERIVDPFEVFCDGSRCSPHAAGLPMYVDDNHLSQAGIARLLRHYRHDLQWVLGGRGGDPQ